MHQALLPCMQVLDFASRRLEQLLLDRGYQIEAVRAVMQESNRDPARVQAAVQQLQVSLTRAASALHALALEGRPHLQAGLCCATDRHAHLPCVGCNGTLICERRSLRHHTAQDWP